MKTRQYMMKIVCMLLFAISLSFVFAQENLSIKKRIVVFSFDDKSGTNYRWWGGKSVGEGMSDMLITELVKSGKYTVLEREHIQEILREKGMKVPVSFTESQAIEAGKLLGAEIAICGAVTEFGYKSRKSGISIKRTDIGFGKNSAVAGMDVRIIDINSGEILYADNIRKKKSVPSGYLGIKNFNIGSESEFDDSMVGEVTRQAIQEVSTKINKKAKNVVWQAKVITVKEGQLYINSGKSSGLWIGAVLRVYSIEEALIDPDTGINLGAIENEIGRIKVVDNTIGEGKASLCIILNGSMFSRGDIVRIENQMPQP